MFVLPSLIFWLAYEWTHKMEILAAIHGTYNTALLAMSCSAVQAEAAS